MQNTEASSLSGSSELPRITQPPPGPESRRWLARFASAVAPMGPRAAPAREGEPAPLGIVYREGHGSNVVDVDGNRYVDLAGGFGSLLLGHDPPSTLAALRAQAGTLLQSLGDVYPDTGKVELLERLCALYAPEPARAILCQSGADAVTAALKTAVLHTGKPGVVAFAGAYHGLSHAPLALCGLRDSYREPFRSQLNAHVRFVDYPQGAAALASVEARLVRELERGDVGAIVFEPIAGRAGCLVPPLELCALLAALGRRYGALLIADEIWTGLGRSGHWLYSMSRGERPDVICLGKGLGGGLPLSACLGRAEVLQAWSREAEVVHTSTFAGAPLACAAGLATLRELEQSGLVLRARRVGERWREQLGCALGRASVAGVELRGEGLMLGIDLGPRPGAASAVQRRLLGQGYIVSTGGGARQVVVLTPALNISEPLLDACVAPLIGAVTECSA